MLPRLLDHDRLPALGREPYQALVAAQMDAADRLASQPDRGAQHEYRQIAAGQVERADVGIETLRDEVDHVRERLVEVVRARDDLGDVR